MTILCRVMQVARSAYYAYRSSKSYVLSQKKAAITKQVTEVFTEHRRRYGSRRVTAELKARGLTVGRFAVRSLMKAQQLEAIRPKRFVPKTTTSNNGLASPNLLKSRENEPMKAKAVIIGDITYLPLCSGRWSYLATFQDKYTRRIVGWSVSNTMSEELVISALRKALETGRINRDAIIHTDRGSQYSSNNFRLLLNENGLRQSMSGRGNCYDNAQAESFFARFKIELLEGGLFTDVLEARSETFSYIEGYYNRVRRHSSLGNKSPMEFEMELENLAKRSSESFLSS